MDDKTPIYMVLIVAIVAVVGLVIILVHNAALSPNAPIQDATTTANTGYGITGDVALESGAAPISINSFGKVFFVVFLVGIVAYMYYRND